MNLRWIIRNGEKVLQQGCDIKDCNGLECFQDVPVHKEPEQQKPRTIADNIRDGAYSDWSRKEPEQKAACDKCLKKDNSMNQQVQILEDALKIISNVRNTDSKNGPWTIAKQALKSLAKMRGRNE